MEILACKEYGRRAEKCPFCGHKTRFGKGIAATRQSRAIFLFAQTIFSVCLVLLLVSLSGCKAEKEGVIDKGNYCYYIIALPSGEIEKYFTPEKEVGQIAYTDIKTTSTVIVKHVPVAEGGWIAYTSSTTAYIPPEAGESGLKSACTYIAMNSDNRMTIQEAKDYIPWLNP